MVLAMIAIELFAALQFAVAFVRRPGDREYGAAALLSVASVVHALAAVYRGHAASPGVADRIAWFGMGAALALSLHFALIYRGARLSHFALYVLYGTSASVVALAWARGIPARTWEPAAFGAAQRAMPLAGAGLVADVLSAAVATATLTLVAQAYLAGRRGALGVVMGATVFLATALNDVGLASGALATGYLSDAGLAALIVGIATTPSARYAAVSNELERRTSELRSRSRELRRSYVDLRNAQEELVKKEQLAVVGELAAVIAHEVRNPLAIIANAVAGLRRQAISREDHDVLLAILDEETSRLNRLVTDLLRYARPVNIQRAQLSIGDLLERALALAHANAKTIGMDLKMEAHEGRMWGDANLLRQVFDNLIDNAVQAMGLDGQLVIRVRVATVDGQDGLAVAIIDTGEGMDTQVRSRALDPFFTTRPSGTGLGLAIVDRIVDAHGGQLSIESRAGEGTTVTVFLPHGSPSELPPRARAHKTLAVAAASARSAPEIAGEADAPGARGDG